MDLGQEKDVPYNAERLYGVELYPNRFDQNLLKRLRLTFLTSHSIMELGGTAQLKADIDFQSPIDEFNEDATVQFLKDAVERDLNTNL